jgi:hypothetical protein
MDATLTGRQPQPWQSGLSLWWLLAGVLVGFLFLLGMLLQLDWIIFLFLGALVLMASLAAPNKKDYFLVLFVLALPLGIYKHFCYRPSPYGISTFGFPIHASFLPLTVLYLIWALRRLQRQEPASLATRGLLPLAGVFGAATVSVLVSQDKLFAAFDLFALGTSMLIFI